MKSAVGESVVSQPVMAKVEQVIESNESSMTVAPSMSKPSQSVKAEVVEKNLEEKNESADSASISSGDKLSYLDIPAFLRRQAD